MAQPMESKDATMVVEELPKPDPTEYALRKRLPRKLPKRKSDVYINTKTDFQGQLERCQKLLDAGVPEIHIHGLGAAINRAMTLALQLQEKSMGSIQMAVNTSTVELVDDYEPLTDELEPESRERNNSAVHIKLYRRTTASS
ncbi:ribonuclease P protein subunit p20-like [Amphiura filiformis]|uniref:ribonuclease P protein subunit p20-like n=1 Tax=Amphiura filiformis TaxID=82378 RepID=UPI003B20CB22